MNDEIEGYKAILMIHFNEDNENDVNTCDLFYWCSINNILPGHIMYNDSTYFKSFLFDLFRCEMVNRYGKGFKEKYFNTNNMLSPYWFLPDKRKGFK